MSKALTMILIAVLVLSIFVMVGCVCGQIIRYPSVPQFTVKLVDSSYDVPPTYEVDPLSGENVTHEGHRVESTSIQIKIKYQHFGPYWDQDRRIYLYYNIRVKGNFSEDWLELYNPEDGFIRQEQESYYTVETYPLGEDADTLLGAKKAKLPTGTQVDFQVEAMIGYTHLERTTFGISWVFEGEKSGWSNTQTIIIGDNQSPEPTSEPVLVSDPNFIFYTGLLLIIVLALFTALMLYVKKRKRQ